MGRRTCQSRSIEDRCVGGIHCSSGKEGKGPQFNELPAAFQKTVQDNLKVAKTEILIYDGAIYGFLDNPRTLKSHRDIEKALLDRSLLYSLRLGFRGAEQRQPHLVSRDTRGATLLASDF
jgi:hypothetical protein